jgi:hypothetical protein
MKKSRFTGEQIISIDDVRSASKPGARTTIRFDPTVRSAC